MGVNDAARSKKEDAQRKAQDKRRRRDHSSSAQGTADWGSVDGALLARAVACVARDGGAIRLGYTRDGGAYAIGFYGDGDPFTEYVPPSDDMEEFLRGVIDDYENG